MTPKPAPREVGRRWASPAWLLLLLLPVCALAVACGDDSATGPSPSPTTDLTLRTKAGDIVRLQAEIADTAEERSVGLMNRDSLPEDRGMLFVFDGQTDAPFWMKDTQVPLSIAFVAADGRILDIQDMQPLSEDLHSSSQPYYFALEVNQGWFGRHDVAIGSTVTGLP